jgi:hypothetical protein
MTDVRDDSLQSWASTARIACKQKLTAQSHMPQPPPQSRVWARMPIGSRGCRSPPEARRYIHLDGESNCSWNDRATLHP